MKSGIASLLRKKLNLNLEAWKQYENFIVRWNSVRILRKQQFEAVQEQQIERMKKDFECKRKQARSLEFRDDYFIRLNDSWFTRPKQNISIIKIYLVLIASQ